MSDSGDIWQRYDAKVVQLREADEKIASLEEALAELREERDRWANTAALLTQKLAAARKLAERLRSVEKGRGRRLGGGGETQVTRLRDEAERAREVIGLMLSALAGSWSGRERAWKAETSNGGRLLYALTRGAMTSVSLSDHRVEAEWIRGLDLDRLRSELGFDEGGLEISIDDEGPAEEPDYHAPGALPPPPSFRTEGAPPQLSTLNPYDDPEGEAEALRPASPRPAAASTVVKPIPPPPFRIGKLVKPGT